MAITWATTDEVLDSLGATPSTAADVAHLDRCVASANAFVYRRRVSSGYTAADGTPEPTDTPPDDGCLFAVVMAAGILYRQRGALDAFPSFEELGTYTPPGVGWGEVYRQAGLNKPLGIF